MVKQTVKYRRMNQDDLAQVVQIQERITRRSVSQPWQDMLVGHVDNTYQCGIVAEVDGRVVGFALGEVKIGEFGTDLSGWVEMMGVEPEYMGQGIGSGLTKALQDYFEEQGLKEVFTSVRWDSGDMLAFFKNLGYDRSPFINLQRRLK